MFRVVPAVDDDVAGVVGGGGGDGVAVADEIALRSLRNYVYYNYCPRKCHQRQGVVSNCKMALCLAIVQ